MSLRVTELWARIVPQKSKLMLAGSKLELGLSKHSKVPWKTLEAKEEQAQGGLLIAHTILFEEILRKPP